MGVMTVFVTYAKTRWKAWFITMQGSVVVLVVANAAPLPPAALIAIMVVTNDSNMTIDFIFITILF